MDNRNLIFSRLMALFFIVGGLVIVQGMTQSQQTSRPANASEVQQVSR
jgi:hypothetical protein